MCGAASPRRSPESSGQQAESASKPEAQAGQLIGFEQALLDHDMQHERKMRAIEVLEQGPSFALSMPHQLIQCEFTFRHRHAVIPCDRQHLEQAFVREALSRPLAQLTEPPPVTIGDR